MGDVAGNVAGDVVGDVAGDVAGDIVAAASWSSSLLVSLDENHLDHCRAWQGATWISHFVAHHCPSYILSQICTSPPGVLIPSNVF